MPRKRPIKDKDNIIPLFPGNFFFKKDMPTDKTRRINPDKLNQLMDCEHFMKVLDYCLELYESSFPGTKQTLYNYSGGSSKDPGILKLLDNPDVMTILQEIKMNPGLEKALIFQLNFFKSSAKL